MMGSIKASVLQIIPRGMFELLASIASMGHFTADCMLMSQDV